MPFDLLRRAAGHPRWAWIHAGTAWVGWGTWAQVAAQGRDRFQKIQRVSTRLGEAPGPQGPAFVGFGFTPEDHRRPPWWQAFPAGMLVVPQEIHGPLTPDPEAFFPRPEEGSIPEKIAGTSPDAWRAAVNAALEAIAQEHLRKVVLARAEVRRFATPPDPVTVLAGLVRRHPEAYCFLYEPTPGVAFVGASPELLVRVRPGGRLETVALAGTAPRGRTPPEDAALGSGLLHSAKDRHEHALVVEAIRRALAPLTVALEVPPEPRLRRLPQVQHLETPIRAMLRPGVGLLQVAQALHPTPALGGVPRTAALRFIAAHEPQPRGWYAAPVGVIFPDGTGELAVGIRSALLLGDRAVLYAGAGIVPGSDPDREWAETELKLRTMRRALAAVALADPRPTLA